MANWHFRTPDVEREEPFAWNPLMERFGMPRGVTVYQTAPGPNYTTKRYASYTDEMGAANLPQNPNVNTTFWPAPSAGLNVFRGGYDWIVDDQTRLDLINSGVVTAANFTPA